MSRNLKLTFFIIFLLYLIIQIFSFSIQKKTNLNFLEKGVLKICAPLQKYISEGVEGVGSVFKHYLFLTETSKQNENLKSQLGALEIKVNAYREIESENKRLLELLSMSEKMSLSFMGARIVAVGISPYQRLIRLDKGVDERVEKNMAVVSSHGVVGHVVEIDKNYSDVLLLSDKVSFIDVINQRTRRRAIVRGDASHELRFEYLSANEDVQKGDVLVASGLDEIYPKGYPVGSVLEVGKRTKQLFREVSVRPFVDFNHLEEVSLVLSTNVIVPNK